MSAESKPLIAVRNLKVGFPIYGGILRHKIAEVRALADTWYKQEDIGAAVSSGSFKTLGMIVAPCTIRSASEIAAGVTSTLLTRAADVVLKERRRLVLMVRETPLHLGHLRTLTTLAEIGAVIAPPVPAFYANPANLNDMIDHTVGRVLDQFDLESGTVRRWKDAAAVVTRTSGQGVP